MNLEDNMTSIYYTTATLLEKTADGIESELKSPKKLKQRAQQLRVHAEGYRKGADIMKETLNSALSTKPSSMETLH